MRRIALIRGDAVDTVASWDGMAVWRPIADAPWDRSVDVTGTAVGPGWAWDAATLTFTSPGVEGETPVIVTVPPEAVDVTQ